MKRFYQRQYHRLGMILLVIFTAASILNLALWQSHGTQLVSVHANTMSPLLHAGDAVMAKPVAFKLLQPSDLVSYRDPEQPSQIKTERIIRIDSAKKLVTVTGDKASAPPETFSSSLVIGRVSYGLPKLGYVIDFLRSRAGLILATYVPAAIILLLELRRLVAFYSHPTYQLRRVPQ